MGLYLHSIDRYVNINDWARVSLLLHYMNMIVSSCVTLDISLAEPACMRPIVKGDVHIITLCFLYGNVRML